MICNMLPELPIFMFTLGPRSYAALRNMKNTRSRTLLQSV